MHDKLHQAIKLLKQHDFLQIQETHSTEGRAQAERAALPQGVNSFWSYGDRRTAGISLWVQESWMKQFATYRWE